MGVCVCVCGLQMLLLATAFPVSAVQTERDDLIRVSIHLTILTLCIMENTLYCIHEEHNSNVRHLVHLMHISIQCLCAGHIDSATVSLSHMW